MPNKKRLALSLAIVFLLNIMIIYFIQNEQTQRRDRRALRLTATAYEQQMFPSAEHRESALVGIMTSHNELCDVTVFNG